jgi:hypothetical protein
MNVAEEKPALADDLVAVSQNRAPVSGIRLK